MYGSRLSRWDALCVLRAHKFLNPGTAHIQASNKHSRGRESSVSKVNGYRMNDNGSFHVASKIIS
jgi:hypothetical protein